MDGGAGADILTLNWNYEDNLHYLTYGLKKADGTWAYFSAGGDQDMAAASLSEIRQVLADGVQQQSYQDKYHWYAGWWYGRTDFSGIEVLNVQGSSWSDLLVYNGGVQTLSGNAGTDTLCLDLSGWTSAVDWVNDGTVKTFANGAESLSVTSVERLLLVTGSGDDVVDNSSNATDDEILTGAGNDNVQSGGNDRIETGAGNDTLNGGSGVDALSGGSGDDTYFMDGSDSVSEAVNQGADTVVADFSATLAANVENLVLTGTDNLNGTGNTLGNMLTGNSGANVLAGGQGNDTYVVDSTDTVVESVNAGTDTILADFTYVLGANLENLTLTGSAAITGYGNSVANILTGNSAANVLNGREGADTLIGGLGDDRYYVDNAADLIIELAGEGSDFAYSTAGSYTIGDQVERLYLTEGSAALNGTGNALDNLLTGNSANNILSGGAGIDTLTALAGNDTLDGGLDADKLYGGLGDDTYVVDNIGDVASENTGEGTDTVLSSITLTLKSNVERLTLTGSTAINALGNSLDNILTGNSGNNLLDGGLGNDTMLGGLGDDTYLLDVAADMVTEAAGGGTDTVLAGWTYTLGANVENLLLTGSAVVDGYGNSNNNILTGNSANNLLNGKTGADTLIGGLGDDRYYVDNTADVITELAGEGSDFAYSTAVSYTIGEQVERLYLTEGSAALNGAGNGQDNTVTGNSANNILSGGAGIDTLTALAGNDTLDGGTGADKLYGGLGDDTYVVDDVADMTFESAGEGTDTVQSSVTLTLKSNVEHLTLTGSAAINATGNTLDNTLTGNSGHNRLEGGLGNDRLVGGLGNDTYVLDVATDVIVEAANAGIDTVQAGWTYVLGSTLENLTLTGLVAAEGYGNDANNVLTGNSAGNLLNGKAGADSMIGGLGDDRYYVDNAGDLAVETVGNGDDYVYSRVDFSLGLAVERLYLLEGTLARNATGNERNNILTGNSANNIFQGGVGDDLLIGAAGNDTYFYGRGGNADTIKENDATAGNSDVLVFQSGIAHDQLWFRRSGDSLIVNLLGSGEKVSVQGWFGSANNQVEVIRTVDDNKTLTADKVEALVAAMAGMSFPATTTLSVAQHAQLDGVIAASWG